MSENPDRSGNPSELRRRAEEKMGQQKKTDKPFSALQTQRLLHELQVHQIELEMQNEELRESRMQLEAGLERFSELYDFAPASYFTLLPEGTIREVNLPGARLLGLERSRVVGGRFETFVTRETRPVFDAWLKQVFSTRIKQRCIVALFKEGKKPVVIEIEAMLSPDGSEGRAVAADITERKALEEKLRQFQKMEVVGQLAGGVAHEFNNILAAMILNLDVLKIRGQAPELPLSPVHNLEELANRAARLTRQLLVFSRRQAMQVQPLEINSALVQLVKMIECLLGEEIACVKRLSERDLWIEADAVMLDQAVMNLCLNAKDAMSSGGTLTLETSLEEFEEKDVLLHSNSRPGRFACIRINDTGCGMSDHVIEHLFEPFFTTKDIGKGTGLGLASVDAIVQQHNGWINVESVAGNGSSFLIYFPLLLGKEPKPPGGTQIPSFDGKNEMILLVEDEKDLRQLGVNVLTMLGYRVLAASNGREAQDLWEQHQEGIDLLLTDMRMPKGISGLQLAKNLLESKPSLKIVIMSGYSPEVVQRDMEGKGGIRYTFLAKPFNLKVLSETVRRCLG